MDPVRVPAPPVPPGQVSIQPSAGGPAVTGLIGQALPQISDGYGGWATIDRTGRTGLSWWPGRNPSAITFAIRFDQRAGQDSVETEIRALEALAGVGLDDDEAPPTVVFNSNGLIPLDQTDPRAAGWVWGITAVDPQEAERDDGTLQRFVAEFNLTLGRLNLDEGLQIRSLAVAHQVKKKTAPSRPKHRTYKVKTGDTLVSISAREYGTPDRWEDIAKANGLRDPRAPLRAGRQLRLPA